jgi:hypothetical protein
MTGDILVMIVVTAGKMISSQFWKEHAHASLTVKAKRSATTRSDVGLKKGAKFGVAVDG